MRNEGAPPLDRYRSIKFLAPSSSALAVGIQPFFSRSFTSSGRGMGSYLLSACRKSCARAKVLCEAGDEVFSPSAVFVGRELAALPRIDPRNFAPVSARAVALCCSPVARERPWIEVSFKQE